MGDLQEISSLSPGTQCHRGAFVRPWTVPCLGESVALETVRVNYQGTCSGTSPQEVVAGIPDDEPYVILPSEVDTGFDVRVCLCHDDINPVEARRTRVAGIRRRPTGLVGEIRP